MISKSTIKDRWKCSKSYTVHKKGSKFSSSLFYACQFFILYCVCTFVVYLKPILQYYFHLKLFQLRDFAVVFLRFKFFKEFLKFRRNDNRTEGIFRMGVEIVVMIVLGKPKC